MSVFISMLFACTGNNVVKKSDTTISGIKEIKKGTYLYKKGCYERSLEHFLKAHELFVFSDDLSGVAMSMNNIGNVYRTTGRIFSATQFFDESCRIFLYINDIEGAVQSLSNKTAALIEGGRLEEAIKEIAEFAKSLGYEYIAITDHSKTARYAGGIDEKRLEEEMVEIDRVQREVGIRIFKGIELEILKDGRLDFDDNILRKLDVVIGAVHIFSKQDMTEAILKACSNPNVDAIAHPTGRLISRREGYQIDMNKVIKYAASTNTALEINAYYDRLDLSDVNAKKAKENGVKIILGSDAHNLRMMKGMRFGVGIARRAWLSKSDVLNSLPADRFETWLKNREIE